MAHVGLDRLAPVGGDEGEERLRSLGARRDLGLEVAEVLVGVARRPRPRPEQGPGLGPAQPLPQFLLGAHEQGFDRGDRGAQHVGDLRIAEAFAIGERDRGALTLRQVADGSIDPPLVFGGFDLMLHVG